MEGSDIEARAKLLPGMFSKFDNFELSDIGKALRPVVTRPCGAYLSRKPDLHRSPRRHRSVCGLLDLPRVGGTQ